MRPQEMSGGFTAKPKNPRKLSSSTTDGMAMVVATMRWLETLGRICLVMIPRADQPTAIAAGKVSVRGKASGLDRTSRLSWGQASTVIAPVTNGMNTIEGGGTGMREVKPG